MDNPDWTDTALAAQAVIGSFTLSVYVSLYIRDEWYGKINEEKLTGAFPSRDAAKAAVERDYFARLSPTSPDF